MGKSLMWLDVVLDIVKKASAFFDDEEVVVQYGSVLLNLVGDKLDGLHAILDPQSELNNPG